jgi:REP element-mobilizing transposase RayT
MAGTYTKIYIQIVFAVWGRENVIGSTWEQELYKYIAGIIKDKGHKPIIVNGMPDHIHAFIGLNPSMAISDLVRDMKSNSSGFIKRKNFMRQQFCWQEGYGGFSYSASQVSDIYNYILHQKSHHQRRSFKDEYLEFLDTFEVPYDERYLFEFY